MAIPGGRYIPKNANGLPKRDNFYSLGSIGYDAAANSYGRWNNIYGVMFIGLALRSKWADVAETFTSNDSLAAG